MSEAARELVTPDNQHAVKPTLDLVQAAQVADAIKSAVNANGGAHAEQRLLDDLDQ